MTASRQISVILTVTAAVALFLLVIAMTRVLERGEVALTEARIGFVLSDLDQTIERNLSLGLPLSELQPIERILERAVASNEEVLALEVLNPAGVAIYSTDRGAVGEPIPLEWQNAIDNREGGRPWRVFYMSTLVVGTEIRNDFNQTAGWLVLILDPRVLPTPGVRLPETLVQSLPYVMAGLLATLVLSVLIGIFVARRFERIAADFANGGDRGAKTEPATLGLGPARTTTASALARIDTAVETLRRIDSEF
ncbi:hypothetical protein [Amorphus sp. 3PC139-8]|uniref:hypothetical protein n=1 Tax=Amorphus sp. 3PC139-8 TaxID=2735676 RepID=UPI00345D194E